MAGATNGIIGEDSPIELPEKQVDDSQITELKQAASFMKTKEYKELEEHLKSRMEFYKQYLPDGRAVGAQDDLNKLTSMWVASNVIIGELQAILKAYETAAELANDATAGREGA